VSKRPNAARLLMLVEQLSEALLNEACDNCGWTYAIETLPPNVAGCTECAGVRAALSEAIETYRHDKRPALTPRRRK
jgi:hypothetical protein